MSCLPMVLYHALASLTPMAIVDVAIDPLEHSGYAFCRMPLIRHMSPSTCRINYVSSGLPSAPSARQVERAAMALPKCWDQSFYGRRCVGEGASSSWVACV